MGQVAVRLAKRLGDTAAESGRLPKGALVRWAMKLLPVLVQINRHHSREFTWDIPPERFARPIILLEQGMSYNAGYAVQVLMP